MSSVVQFNIFALSHSLSSVISSGQMGYLIPQALSQLDLVVPRGPQHNHSLSFPIPTVQEVTLHYITSMYKNYICNALFVRVICNNVGKYLH